MCICFHDKLYLSQTLQTKRIKSVAWCTARLHCSSGASSLGGLKELISLTIRSAMVLLLAAMILLDIRSTAPPEHRRTTDTLNPADCLLNDSIISCRLSVFTLHVQQDSSGLRDDQRAGSQVPNMHPDLIIRFDTAGRHQTHVDGCGSCTAHAGDMHTLSKLHIYGCKYFMSVVLLQD